jgi:CheY-like chemotaxis protein
MTGYDLARKLREHTATSKIYLVAMTGYGQSADRMEARHSGFDEHMVKPVDIAKLRALFDRLSQS